MGIVAHTALLETSGVMGVGLDEGCLLMAIEAAPFEPKAAAFIDLVALGTFYVGERRVLMEGAEACGRTGSDEEMNFLPTAIP